MQAKAGQLDTAKMTRDLLLAWNRHDHGNHKKEKLKAESIVMAAIHCCLPSEGWDILVDIVAQRALGPFQVAALGAEFGLIAKSTHAKEILSVFEVTRISTRPKENGKGFLNVVREVRLLVESQPRSAYLLSQVIPLYSERSRGVSGLTAKLMQCEKELLLNALQIALASQGSIERFPAHLDWFFSLPIDSSVRKTLPTIAKAFFDEGHPTPMNTIAHIARLAGDNQRVELFIELTRYTLEQQAPVVPVALSFIACFDCRGSVDARLNLLQDAFHYYQEQGWRIGGLVRLVSNLDAINIDRTKELLTLLKPFGGSLDTITPGLFRNSAWTIVTKKEVLPYYVLLSQALQGIPHTGNPKEEIYVRYNRKFVDLLASGASPQLAAKLSEAVRQGVFVGRELDVLAAELATHSALLVLQGNPSKKDEERAYSSIMAWTDNDHIPYPQEDPRNEKTWGEVLNVMRGGFDQIYGFSAQTYDCRRLPDGGDAMIVRCGDEIMASVNFIHAEDPNEFPGKGFMFGGMDLHRVFGSDPTRPEDPFHQTKQAMPWLTDAIEAASRTYFGLMRGRIMLSSKHDLAVIDGLHYDYGADNEHHRNIRPEFHLIPSQAIWPKVTPCLVSRFGALDGVRVKLQDINGAGVSSQALREFCRRSNVNFLDLAWFSCVGGLCNAYPIDSEPYHRWEKGRREDGETTDKRGRVHKTHAVGKYLEFGNKKLEEVLVTLRRAHTNVYRTAMFYQDLWDLFRIALARYHCGLTLGPGDDYDESASLASWDNIHPARFRMLREAYRWHAGLREKRAKREDYPVLVIASALSYRAQPDSPVTLDTFDMKATVKRDSEVRRIALPQERNRPDERGELFWLQEVMPRVSNVERILDLRFYHRGDLPELSP